MIAEYLPHILCIGFIFLFLVFPTWLRITYSEWKAKKEHAIAVKAGRHEPVTIQPLIDLKLCMGAGACITACPEDVLKIIDGQAVSVNTAACVGHGACVEVCPVDAVELVFGSDNRGIDIPKVGANFETNVPGLFVAGELGGMGLIANAIEQGAQAMENCAAGLQPNPDRWDVVIVGAGPAGIAAAAIAKEQGLRYVLLEQGEFGGAIRHYPRQKLVFVRPMMIPGYGKVNIRQMLKEDLIGVFEKVVEKLSLEVTEYEAVTSVKPLDGDGFEVVTTKGRLQTTRVLLCLGRRGTPRKLGVDGEDDEKVAYWLKDPELYQYRHLLIVGGGDSAVEAACSLGEQEGNRVWLSYRRGKITRPKKKNVDRLRKAVKAGQVELLLESQVKEIGVDRVNLTHKGEEVVIPNDFVFVMVGGVLPTQFLKAAGIDVQRHFGRRIETA